MRVGGSLLDVRPLRASPDFRRLWVGTTASAVGGQVTVVAVLFQVWELTHSSAWVGAVGLAGAVPTVVLGLLGGTLADAVDRRRLVLWSSAGAAAAAVLLAAQALAGAGSLALVLALVALQRACAAIGAPARRTFVPRLLPADLVPGGVALSHVSFQAAMLLGPAAAGLLLARAGLTAAYLLDAACLVLALYGVARLPPMRPQHGAQRAGLRSTWEGWRFVARRPVVRGSIATDVAATVLAMPVALFPALNEQRSDGGPETLGLFLSAIAVGGITAGLLSGVVTRAARPGAVMLAAACTWGASLAALGLVDGLTASLACLAVAGAADTVAVISRGTVVALATPDSHLGRVSSVENVVGVAGPGLGDARAGAVAGLTSASFSATTGGLACLLAVAAVAATNPDLRRWRHRDHAAAPAPAPTT